MIPKKEIETESAPIVKPEIDKPIRASRTKAVNHTAEPVEITAPAFEEIITETIEISTVNLEGNIAIANKKIKNDIKNLVKMKDKDKKKAKKAAAKEKAKQKAKAKVKKAKKAKKDKAKKEKVKAKIKAKKAKAKSKKAKKNKKNKK